MSLYNLIAEKYQTYEQQQFSNQTPQELYAPVQYIMSLGGKKLRPILLLLSYSIFKDDFEKALPSAYSIELFHNFSLVHDDIMDEADKRRGQPAVHKKFGQNSAILSGDVMLAYCYNYLLNSNAPTAALKMFSTAAIRICEGQQYDMNFETSDAVTIDDYLKMIEYKTAHLLAAALGMGGLIADADARTVNSLYQIGINAGIAFQIQDDVLDIYGDSQKVGKTKGGDILQGKKTYLYLKTLELLGPADRESFTNLYASTDPNKIEKVLEHFKSANAKGYAEELQIVYMDLAKAHLDQLPVTEATTILRALIASLLGREF